MSWYDNWNNWLNTTIDGVSHNAYCNSYYYFKSNSQNDKQYYNFGRIEHYEHKMHWVRTHRGRRTLI